MLKEFLNKNSVSYENKDVSSDLAAREEMIHKSHQMGVPVTDIDGGNLRRLRPRGNSDKAQFMISKFDFSYPHPFALSGCLLYYVEHNHPSQPQGPLGFRFLIN